MIPELVTERLLLRSLIHPNNERPIRVAQRLGERFERRVELSGTLHHVYAIERDRWAG